VPILPLPDAEIVYEVSGSGPALLFNSATAWAGKPWTLHQVPEFARDHTVIVYDQRGTGGSTARGTDFSTERLAADAIALLDHLGIARATACGHSNGGRVSQMMAITYPERVERLILCSAGATHGVKGVPVKMIVGLVEKGYREYCRDSAVKSGSTTAYYASHRESVDAFVELILEGMPPLDIFLRYVIGRSESDTTARIGEIKAPTLVMIGDDETHSDSGDTHFDFAQRLAAGIPNAKLVIFPGEGHHYPFYSPGATNRAIRQFLV
jgi:pimeloyl-ACP methyl ester carboxylesterase